MVTGSGVSLGKKIGVLVEVVMVVAVAAAVAVADGQNQSVEVKSLTGQLSSMRRTVLVRTGLAGTVPLRELGTTGMLGEGAAMPEKKSLVTE
jgi:type II secretory pathway component PulK